MELSIGIPAYGQPELLERAIDSILKQNNKRLKFTVIVSEDYSTEENHKEIIRVIEKYSSIIPIQYYFNKPGLGMCENWNQCIRKSVTKYAALLHDDDYFMSNYFDEVEKIFYNKVDFDVLFWNNNVSVDGIVEEEGGGKVKRIYTNLKKDKFKRIRPSDYFFGGLEGKMLPSCGTLYNTENFEGYKSEDGFSADEIYAEKICTRSKVLYKNTIVAVHTYRSQSGGGGNLSSKTDTKRGFVLERMRHRKEMSDKSLIFKFCNKFLLDGMRYNSTYPWNSELFPELKITANMKRESFIFDIIKKVYIYTSVLSYRRNIKE